jgi:hypothetical protein
MPLAPSSKLAKLQHELDAIHLANKEYWASATHTHEATAHYQRRQERLEQIRKDMRALKKKS